MCEKVRNALVPCRRPSGGDLGLGGKDLEEPVDGDHLEEIVDVFGEVQEAHVSALGADFLQHVDEHAHDFQHWKKALYQFSQLIFKPGAK